LLPTPALHIHDEQQTTDLIITAVDLVDNRHLRRSQPTLWTWTTRRQSQEARARSVHGSLPSSDSCHSSVHIGSCADARLSTLSTELSTIGENVGLTWDDIVRRAHAVGCVTAVSFPRHCRAEELELLILAVSSVTWLKIARRSFISSLIFLFACMTVVWSRPPNSSPMRIS